MRIPHFLALFPKSLSIPYGVQLHPVALVKANSLAMQRSENKPHTTPTLLG
ncbi:MAG: hypothetical protein LBJ70_05150 [Holosporales bacterium]|nr:hypothetical protein [Holosporales bacterium]